MIAQDTTYILDAKNTGGSISKRVTLDIDYPPSPRPPTNVDGIVGSNAITITWEFDSSVNPNNRNAILGFSIYYASEPGAFVLWADDVDASVRQWAGNAPTCGDYKMATRYTDLKTDTATTTAALFPPVYSNDWPLDTCQNVAAPESPP